MPAPWTMPQPYLLIANHAGSAESQNRKSELREDQRREKAPAAAAHQSKIQNRKSKKVHGLGSTERLTVVERVTLVLLPSVPMSVSLKTPDGVPTGAGLILFW
jgi:hypothetical protein